MTVCRTCGHELAIGEHPFCPHGFATTREYRPFRPYFDLALGETITSLAQWNRTMRDKHADLSDGPSKGQLAARKDRCMAIRKAEGRRT